MRKRLILCAIIITLCVLAACGKAEEPVTTEPTTAPPTTAAPTTKAPEPETVISYDFHLKELPEIGKHQTKQAAYFYDAPLREFKPSGRYGTLIPYALSDSKSDYSSLGNYGFMTADGKIVTGPIYESVYEQTLGGKTIFFATQKVLDKTPETIPDWDEDAESARAAYDRAEEHFYDNVRYDLISEDGNHCLTTHAEPRFYSNEDADAAVISCAVFRDGDSFSQQRYESFFIYDTDFNLIGEYARYLRGYDYAWIFDVEKDGFVIKGERYSEEDGVSENDLLFFEDGELDHTLEMANESPYRMAGHFAVCDKRIYDSNGHTVYESGDDMIDVVYDYDSDCLYIINADKHKLIKLDSRGNMLASEETDFPVEYTSIYLIVSGGKTYVVVPYGGDYNNRIYRVYDSNLRQLSKIGGEDTTRTAFFSNDGAAANSIFLVAKDGKTEVFDITGKVVATISFDYEDYDLNNWMINDNLLYLYQKNGKRAIFNTSDYTYKIMPSDNSSPRNPTFFSQKLLVFSESVYEDSYEYRYVIQNMASGKRLLDNITDFDTFSANGKIYFNYIRNGTLYVCDEDLNVITALYDDNLF